MRLRKLLPLIALLAPLLGACEPNAMGRKSFKIMPESMLQAQAAEVYAKEKHRKPISQNRRHRDLVQQVGRRLIAIAERDYANYSQGFSWEVTLFENPKTKNAYCMPGGKIAIYSGILPICQNEAALAAVMGHEIAHALLRHGNERVTQQLGIAALAIGTKQVTDKKENISKTQQRNIMIAVGLGSELFVALPFSRTHEREADYMGLRIMAKAGYDPSEAPALWERMQKSSDGRSLPEFLSTHPSQGSRIEDLRSKQKEALDLYRRAPQKYGTGQSF